ncbi:MAG: DUF3137 domain-containing protein [Bacteroidetes bacterium]|nr:DUF3137 domain-containing protein [Bacteroidota bacterium]
MGRPDVVRLEDVEFEKQFVVYSSDEVEARYILSTSFMEQIMAFKRKQMPIFNCRLLAIMLMWAIPMKENMFEPSIRKTVLNFEDIKMYYSQLQFLCCYC